LKQRKENDCGGSWVVGKLSQKRETFYFERENIFRVVSTGLSRVEEGYNTSIVALRDTEVDEKGAQCLGV
jgi:hypothetical protein